MERFQNFLQKLSPYALCAIWGPMLVAQIVLAFVLPPTGNATLRLVGFIIWWLSAFFGWLPIFLLRRKGGVPRGKSYVHTTKLVDTGLYAIVRHPQMGTAGILMSLALMLFTQRWISILLGFPAMALIYLDLLLADQRCIEKFGEAYRDYMQRVPRVNFVAGLIRLICSQRSVQR